MAFLVDTNVLLRSSHQGHVQQPVAAWAVAALRRRGESLCLARQNLVENRNVATRPAAQNGLGLSAREADAELTQMEQDFNILSDTDAIYFHWRTLVAGLSVMGKQVHDARLVAVMLTYRVTHLLTFNDQDFLRFQRLPPTLGAGIIVAHPTCI